MEQFYHDEAIRKSEGWATAALIVWGLGVLPILMFIISALMHQERHYDEVQGGFAALDALLFIAFYILCSALSAGFAMYARRDARPGKARIALIVNGICAGAMLLILAFVIVADAA